MALTCSGDQPLRPSRQGAEHADMSLEAGSGVATDIDRMTTNTTLPVDVTLVGRSRKGFACDDVACVEQYSEVLSRCHTVISTTGDEGRFSRGGCAVEKS